MRLVDVAVCCEGVKLKELENRTREIKKTVNKTREKKKKFCCFCAFDREWNDGKNSQHR
jgi:hypothetical protein